MRVDLVCVTMAGNQYVHYEAGFPRGELRDGEAPADAARRVVKEWTGTDAPKLELVDLRAQPGALLLVFRAMLVSDPEAAAHGTPRRADRMGLPEKVGALSGRDVDEMLKTSLAYKLTRG